jgi:hypothetical protein
MVEPLLSGIVLGLMAVTLVGVRFVLPKFSQN